MNFFATETPVEDHLAVGAWNLFAFLLVFGQKNVALLLIWTMNQIFKRIWDLYFWGLFVFEYKKLNDQVVLSAYVRE